MHAVLFVDILVVLSKYADFGILAEKRRYNPHLKFNFKEQFCIKCCIFTWLLVLIYSTEYGTTDNADCVHSCIKVNYFPHLCSIEYE